MVTLCFLFLKLYSKHHPSSYYHPHPSNFLSSALVSGVSSWYMSCVASALSSLLETLFKFPEFGGASNRPLKPTYGNPRNPREGSET